MKNSVKISIGIIAVLLVAGVAIYFANPQSQKGAMFKLPAKSAPVITPVRSTNDCCDLVLTNNGLLSAATEGINRASVQLERMETSLNARVQEIQDQLTITAEVASRNSELITANNQLLATIVETVNKILAKVQ